MPATGEGRRGVLVVAEAPGQAEDEQGIQLIGRAGQKLRERLERIGVDLDEDCWKTNAICCRPPNNEKPTSKQVAACRPNVMRAIADLKPCVILLCGATAVESVIGAVWQRRGGIGEIGRWVGWRIPSGRWDAWVCPTWHPSYLLRENEPVLELLFDQHLEAAFAFDSWQGGNEDRASRVELVYEADQAASILRRMRDKGGSVAFDFETNMLKPDSPDARIVCCSVCWEGRKTIAFPWVGAAVDAMAGLLCDPGIRKRGWNIKFEDRWVRQVMGQEVRGWEWDGMLAAHLLDNRAGITSLKFQSFVRLGVEPYDSAVGTFLAADGSNVKNRVDKAPMRDLLLYNDLDSLLTWELSELQRAEVGV